MATNAELSATYSVGPTSYGIATRLRSIPNIGTEPTIRDFAALIQAAETSQVHAGHARRSYRLEQFTFNTQTLTSFGVDNTTPSFMINFSDSTFNLNKKPHVTIDKRFLGQTGLFAEIRFGGNAKSTTIFYKETGVLQTLSTTALNRDVQECHIAGKQHTWQPLGPSQTVLELVNEDIERVAIFMYPEENNNQTGLLSARKVSRAGREIGQLHVIQAIEERAFEEILGSAVAVVGNVKRRASV